MIRTRGPGTDPIPKTPTVQSSSPALVAVGLGGLEGVVQGGAGAGLLPRSRLLVAEVAREGPHAQEPDQRVQLPHPVLQHIAIMVLTLSLFRSCREHVSWGLGGVQQPSSARIAPVCK